MDNTNTTIKRAVIEHTKTGERRQGYFEHGYNGGQEADTHYTLREVCDMEGRFQVMHVVKTKEPSRFCPWRIVEVTDTGRKVRDGRLFTPGVRPDVHAGTFRIL